MCWVEESGTVLGFKNYIRVGEGERGTGGLGQLVRYSPASYGHRDSEKKVTGLSNMLGCQDAEVTGLRNMPGCQDAEEGPGRGTEGAQAVPKDSLTGSTDSVWSINAEAGWRWPSEKAQTILSVPRLPPAMA